MNKVTNSLFDKKSSLGSIELNRAWFSVYRVEIGYDEKNFRHRMGYGVKVANDFNISNPFWLKARTIKALIRKIEKHEYKLVKV